MREREKESETEGHIYKKNMLLFLSSYPDTHKTHKDFTQLCNSASFIWNHNKTNLHIEKVQRHKYM